MKVVLSSALIVGLLVFLKHSLRIVTFVILEFLFLVYHQAQAHCLDNPLYSELERIGS